MYVPTPSLSLPPPLYPSQSKIEIDYSTNNQPPRMEGAGSHPFDFLPPSLRSQEVFSALPPFTSFFFSFYIYIYIYLYVYIL